MPVLVSSFRRLSSWEREEAELNHNNRDVILLCPRNKTTWRCPSLFSSWTLIALFYCPVCFLLHNCFASFFSSEFIIADHVIGGFLRTSIGSCFLNICCFLWWLQEKATGSSRMIGKQEISDLLSEILSEPERTRTQWWRWWDLFAGDQSVVMKRHSMHKSMTRVKVLSLEWRRWSHRKIPTDLVHSCLSKDFTPLISDCQAFLLPASLPVSCQPLCQSLAFSVCLHSTH